MTNKEKTFHVKLYALVAFFAVAASLVLMVTLTFKAKYTAYHPEEVARVYVDTVVQTGDGYNAYKNSLLSVREKYGDFIRQNYMYPIIYREAGYKPGDKTDALKGLNDEALMGEKSKTDNGTLQGQVIDTMYGYFVELVANGWDDYDAIFTKYFDKLVEVRKAVFGDTYMTDEIMFTALEANVKTYGESLTGTKDEFDKNTKEQISFKSTGAYQTAYGEDYKFTACVKSENEIALESYKAALNAEKLATYGISADEIGAVKSYTVEVQTEDGKTVAEPDVTVVQIKNSWYVDNTATDTTVLYNFYK